MARIEEKDVCPGGMGFASRAVYSDGKTVFVKAMYDPGHDSMLQLEYRVLEYLAPSEFFPKVISLKTVTHDESVRLPFKGRIVLVEEWLEGGVTLNDIIDAYVGLGLSEETVINIAFDAFMALSVLQRAGFAHRDLHPGNIYVFPRGLKLIDLGCAIRLGDIDDEKTVKNGYNPPPPRKGHPYTTSFDVVALAGCLASALCGSTECPHPGDLPQTCFGRFLADAMAGNVVSADIALDELRQISSPHRAFASLRRMAAVYYTAAIRKK